MISSGYSVASVHVGRIAPLGRTAQPSAIVKHAVAGTVAVGPLGLAGDEQADRRVHGGPEKAVYAYDAGGYPAWAADFPKLADRFGFGAMGENLALLGLDETSVCIGDQHRIGSVLLQVSQPRQPCATLALKFDEPRIGKVMVKSGRSGWYYRVLEAGHFTAGDTVEVTQRINPDWSVARFAQFAVARRREAGEVRQIAALPGLAPQWQRSAQRWLAATGDA